VIRVARGYALDGPLRRLIGRLDKLLQRLQGITEFSGHSHCLLRIARAVAEKDVRLADGCIISRGAEVLDLHLWNEHVWSLPPPSCGLARATALRGYLRVSLCELAICIETDPSLGAVAALRARAAFVPRRRIQKVLRIARAFGFDTAASAPPDVYPYGFWESLLLWALAWRFNPSTLRRNGVLRSSCELWISRGALIAGCAGLALVIRNQVQSHPTGSQCGDLPTAERRTDCGQ
jgi:hypothetical protein